MLQSQLWGSGASAAVESLLDIMSFPWKHSETKFCALKILRKKNWFSALEFRKIKIENTIAFGFFFTINHQPFWFAINGSGLQDDSSHPDQPYRCNNCAIYSKFVFFSPLPFPFTSVLIVVHKDESVRLANKIKMYKKNPIFWPYKSHLGFSCSKITFGIEFQSLLELQTQL